MGPGAKDALQHLIEPQHIPVEELPLAGEAGGESVADVPVHIPFHIVHPGAVQHLPHRADDVGPHVGVGQIQHPLVAAQGGGLARGAQGIVGMGPEQIAVLVDALRLKPQAKVHPQALHGLGELLQPMGQLFAVDAVIPQPGRIAIPLAEPAVVQHKQLGPQLFGALGQPPQLPPGKAEKACLPVVEQHGPLLALPLPPHDVAVHEIPKAPGDAVEALGA